MWLPAAEERLPKLKGLMDGGSKTAETDFFSVYHGQRRATFANLLKLRLAAQVKLRRHFRTAFDQIAPASYNSWQTQAVTITCLRAAGRLIGPHTQLLLLMANHTRDRGIDQNDRLRVSRRGIELGPIFFGLLNAVLQNTTVL